MPIPSLPRKVRFFPAEIRAVTPRTLDASGLPLKVSDWTRAYRMVMRGKKAMPWTDDMAPYAAWVMDLWSLPWVRKIYLCWAPRTAKTNVAISCLLYSADQDPGPAMYVMPVEALAKHMMRNRLRPTIRAMKHMSHLMQGAYDATSTFLGLSNGAQISVTWATSEAMMSSEDVEKMIIDECDKEQYSSGNALGKRQNPLLLAEVRTGNYPHTKKIMIISSPSPEPSNVWEGLKTECDVVYALEVPCPVCGHRQIMTLDRIIYPDTVTDHRIIKREKLGRYACPKCDVFATNHWDDNMRSDAVRAARWVPGRVDDEEWKPIDPKDIPARPVAVGVWLPGWCSPDVSLSDVAACAFRAKTDIEQEIELCARYAAVPHRVRMAVHTPAEVLARRTSLSSGIVPAGALALTAGVDVQKHGFWFVIRAWMGDLTSHKILHGFVPSFAELEQLLFKSTFPIQGSQSTMGVWRAAIDTGGNATLSEVWTRTEEIYEWLNRHNQACRLANCYPIVYGIKGASKHQQIRINPTTIEKMPNSHLPIPGGLVLRILDTAATKDIIHWRMDDRTGDDTQRFYLDADTDMEYARQFVSETRVIQKGKVVWIARGPNHLFDCEVYAAACADRQWFPSLQYLQDELKARNALAEQLALAAANNQGSTRNAPDQTRRW